MKLDVELIKIPYSYLEEQHDGDIYNYFDCEWGSDINWMNIFNTDKYIVLDYSDGKIYMVEFITDKKGR